MSRCKNTRHHDPGFGAFIRKERLEKFPGLSAIKFASDVGITSSYLSAIELDKAPPPSLEKVFILAEKLELDKIQLAEMAGRLHQEFMKRMHDV